jgi:hypothetical protein
MNDYFNQALSGNRKPPTVWMKNNPKQKLEYCNRQSALLKKWFDETGNVFFLKQIPIWIDRIRHITAGTL